MAVTITSSPTFPVIAKGAALSFVLTGGGNFVRLWCAAAPLASSLGQQLADAKAIDPTAIPRIEIFSGVIPSDPAAKPFTFRPDVPGRYTLIAQEYRRGASSFGGGYSGDPRGFDTETKPTGVGEDTLTIDFGQRCTEQLGVAPDIATLVFYVFGDYPQLTTFELHGENSPAIIEPKTPIARNVASQYQGTAQALATSGLTATVLNGDMNALVDSAIAAWNGHFTMTSSSVHATADTYNVVSTAVANPNGNKKATIAAVKELLTTLTQHLTTDQIRRTPFVSSGLGSGAWHNPSGSAVVADNQHLPIAPIPTDMASAYVALSDCYSCYSSHALSTDVHGAADSTHSLTASPRMMQLHIAFLDQLRKMSPAVYGAENPGVQVFVNVSGAKAS